jgi:ADP-ribose pyrophosphatase YjhB (NUDIX family)
LTKLTFNKLELGCKPVKAVHLKALRKNVVYLQMERLMYDIFISQVHADISLSMSLKANIQKDFNGLKVFLSQDYKDMKPGNWPNQVKTALEESQVVVILCSPASIRHPWVHLETGAAWITLKEPIILALGGLQRNELPFSTFLQAQQLDRIGVKWMYTTISERFRKYNLPDNDAIDRTYNTLKDAVREDEDRRSDELLTQQVNSIITICAKRTSIGTQYLLIRDRTDSYWTVPKGFWEPHRDVRTEIARELTDEAGVTKFSLVESPIKIIRYGKSDGRTRVAAVYLAEVIEQLNPTEAFRKPHWYSLKATVDLLIQDAKNPHVQELADAFILADRQLHG